MLNSTTAIIVILSFKVGFKSEINSWMVYMKSIISLISI